MGIVTLSCNKDVTNHFFETGDPSIINNVEIVYYTIVLFIENVFPRIGLLSLNSH